MNRAEIIHATLEQVAARVGDPTGRVYARLFELYPEFEDLFVMDVDGGVRGSMLQTSLECVIGVAEGESEAAHIVLGAARVDHDGYGLSEDQVDLLFVAMRDTFRDILGETWTPETETVWAGLLEELARIGRQASQAT
ncbi:MAG: globin [Hyphomonadaceae bacterium]|nr:globin [Hyphomonadaceae bacterium]